MENEKLVRFLVGATKILSGLLALVMVFAAVAIVATWISPEPILLRAPADQLVVRTPSLDLRFDLAQERHPSQTVIYSMLGALTIVACNLIILLQLRKILITVLERDPFVAENAGRLRVIAFAIFATTLLGTLTHAFSSWWVHDLIKLPNVEAVVRWRLDFGMIGAGLLILVLAEVFRLGLAMKEEQDLTI